MTAEQDACLKAGFGETHFLSYFSPEFPAIPRIWLSPLHPGLPSSGGFKQSYIQQCRVCAGGFGVSARKKSRLGWLLKPSGEPDCFQVWRWCCSCGAAAVDAEEGDRGWQPGQGPVPLTAPGIQ